MLYSLISSLTTLSVCGWVISPRETINWQSLKTLSITDVNLSDGAMEKLLSGCPSLEVLHLTQCYGFYCLNIFSSNFTKLEIERCDSLWKTIEISAHYARELKIEYDEYALRDDKISPFRLRDMTSLVRVSLDFNYVSVPQIHMIELLKSLQYVKKLELRDGCFASLAELDGLNYIPPSTRQCLTLNIRHEVSFPGILFIFKSSPYLETLTIQGDFDYFEGIPEEETSEEEILELCIPEQIVKYIENIDLVFHHLKTINITCYDCESMMILAQLLLKSSNVLQKMNLSYSGEECCEELSRTVLALPKASPEAIVTVVNHW